MKKIIALILASLMLFVFVGCGSTAVTPVLPEGEAVTPIEPLPDENLNTEEVVGFTEFPEHGIDSSYILKIDGEEISVEEYRQMLFASKAFFDNYDNGFWTTEEADAALVELKSSVEEALRSTMALEKVAADNGIELTEEELTTLAADVEANLLAQFGGDIGLLNQALQAEFISFDFLVEQNALNLLSNKIYLEFFGETGMDGSVQFTPEEMLAYSVEQENVAVKHVLVTEEGLADAKDAEGNAYPDLETLANDITTRARAGEDFDTLIETYGEDPGMENSPQGYLFTYGMMVPEFEEMSFELEEGAISDPVLTDYGYHIILKLPHDETLIADFADQLVYEMAERYVTELVETEYESYEVEYFDGYDSLELETFYPGLYEMESPAVG